MDDGDANGLEVFILAPQNTEVSLQDVLQDEEGSAKIDFLKLQQRSLLYFDEQLLLYIVLRTSRSRQAIQELTRRLFITLELRAQGSIAQSSSIGDGERQQQTSRQDDMIWQGHIDTTTTPRIVPEQNDVRKPALGNLLVIWQCQAILSRPRVRLQTPAVVFNATAVLRPKTSLGVTVQLDPYMMSGEPVPENLFAPLGRIKLSSSGTPNTPSFTLNKARTPSMTDDVESTYLHVTTPEPISALPVISTRIHHLRSRVKGKHLSTLVVLDLEISRFSRRPIELSSVVLSVPRGTAEDLGKGLAPKLPHRCQPGDKISYVFRLALDDPNIGIDHQGMAQAVDIIVKAHVLSTSHCRPEILTHWKTVIDFSVALKHAHGIPGQSLQRHNRPADLSLVATDPRYGDVADTTLEMDSGVSQKRRDVLKGGRLKVTLNGPSKAYVYEEFSLEVLITNGTGERRKLTLSTLTRQELDGNAESGREGATVMIKAGLREDGVSVAHMRNTEQRGATNGNTEVLSLSAAQGLGMLEHGACHSTVLRYMPMQAGQLQLGPICISDAEEGTFVDIYEVPTVLVESR